MDIKAAKKSVDFEIPQSTQNIEPAIASIPSPHDKDISIKHEPKLSGAFKTMAERGIKFTSYTTTDGAGNPLREDEDDE